MATTSEVLRSRKSEHSSTNPHLSQPESVPSALGAVASLEPQLSHLHTGSLEMASPTTAVDPLLLKKITLIFASCFDEIIMPFLTDEEEPGNMEIVLPGYSFNYCKYLRNIGKSQWEQDEWALLKKPTDKASSAPSNPLNTGEPARLESQQTVSKEAQGEQ